MKAVFSENCSMAELCFHHFVHFDCVPIYIYIYKQQNLLKCTRARDKIKQKTHFCVYIYTSSIYIFYCKIYTGCSGPAFDLLINFFCPAQFMQYFY